MSAIEHAQNLKSLGEFPFLEGAVGPEFPRSGVVGEDPIELADFAVVSTIVHLDERHANSPRTSIFTAKSLGMK